MTDPEIWSIWGDRQQEYLEQSIADQEERERIVKEYELLSIRLGDLTITREGDFIDFTVDASNGWILHSSCEVVAFWGKRDYYQLMELSQRWLVLEQQLLEAGAI